MKEIEMEEKEEREGKEAEGYRKEKTERGKRRKIKEMRQLSLGCRARNKAMICIRTAWPLFTILVLGLSTLQVLSEIAPCSHCSLGLHIHTSRPLCCLPWYILVLSLISLIINYHSSSQRQLVTFLPVASCLYSDMISEDVSSHPSTYHSKATFWFCCWVCALVLSPWVFCLFPMAHTLYVPDLWWWSISNLLGPGTKLLAGFILMRLHSFRTTQGHVSFESIKFAKQIPDCLHLYTSSDMHGCLKLCSHLHCPFVSQWWCEDSDVT